MKRLLNIELIKIYSNSGFWVPAIFWAVLYAASLLIVTQINVNFTGIDSTSFFKFPTLWNVTTWIASWFNLLLSIIIIIVTGIEFSHKTFRQHIIDGLTRIELLKAKIFLILVFAFVAFVIVLFCTLIIGLIYNDSNSWLNIIDNIELIFVFFIQSVAYMLFALMITLLIKNIALSILTFILYFISFEPIVRNFFPDNILYFFPMKVISNLTPPPDILQFATQANFQTTINGQVVNDSNATQPFEISLLDNTVAAMIYIAIFIFISAYIIKRKKL